MSINELVFEPYLTSIKEKKKVSARELTRKPGICAPYSTEVEHHRKVPLVEDPHNDIRHRAEFIRTTADVFSVSSEAARVRFESSS